MSGNATRISFREPLHVSGQLTTANGTALANRSVRFRVAERTLRTETDSDGRFELLYQPTSVPVTVEQVTVQYRPQNSSVYAAATASLPVRIRQVTVPVTVTQEPAEHRFGETATVSGAVETAPVDAADVPLEVTLAETVRTDATTNATGAYRTAVRIPAAISPGSHALTASIADGRALAGSANTTIAVVESASTLTLSVGQQGPNRVQVQGRLIANDGTPVAGQPIRLSLNGTPATTVETDEQGRYATVVSAPALAANGSANRTVAVNARFDGTGTNIDSAQNATTTILIAPPETPQSIVERLRDIIDGAGLFGLLVLVLVVAGVGILAYRRPPLSLASSTVWTALRRRIPWIGSTATEPGPEGSDEHATASAAASESDPSSPYAVAYRRLESGSADEAVQLGYAITRDRLANVADVDTSGTHREFLDSVREAPPGRRRGVARTADRHL